LLDERNQARYNKNWEKSDEIRDKIKELGYEVQDEQNESKLIKI